MSYSTLPTSTNVNNHDKFRTNPALAAALSASGGSPNGISDPKQKFRPIAVSNIRPELGVGIPNLSANQIEAFLRRQQLSRKNPQTSANTPMTIVPAAPVAASGSVPTSAPVAASGAGAASPPKQQPVFRTKSLVQPSVLDRKQKSIASLAASRSHLSHKQSSSLPNRPINSSQKLATATATAASGTNSNATNSSDELTSLSAACTAAKNNNNSSDTTATIVNTHNKNAHTNININVSNLSTSNVNPALSASTSALRDHVDSMTRKVDGGPSKLASNAAVEAAESVVSMPAETAVKHRGSPPSIGAANGSMAPLVSKQSGRLTVAAIGSPAIVKSPHSTESGVIVGAVASPKKSLDAVGTRKSSLSFSATIDSGNLRPARSGITAAVVGKPNSRTSFSAIEAKVNQTDDEHARRRKMLRLYIPSARFTGISTDTSSYSSAGSENDFHEVDVGTVGAASKPTIDNDNVNARKDSKDHVHFDPVSVSNEISKSIKADVHSKLQKATDKVKADLEKAKVKRDETRIRIEQQKIKDGLNRRELAGKTDQSGKDQVTANIGQVLDKGTESRGHSVGNFVSDDRRASYAHRNISSDSLDSVRTTTSEPAVRALASTSLVPSHARTKSSASVQSNSSSISTATSEAGSFSTAVSGAGLPVFPPLYWNTPKPGPAGKTGASRFFKRLTAGPTKATKALHHHSKSEESVMPVGTQPVKPVTLRTTMRKQPRVKSFNEDKPWKHHSDAEALTDREKSRYERLWATNKGIHVKYLCRTHLQMSPSSSATSLIPTDSLNYRDALNSAEISSEERLSGDSGGGGSSGSITAGDSASTSASNSAVASASASASAVRMSIDSSVDDTNSSGSFCDDVHGYIVRDIWKRSRLPDETLANIWDLVARNDDGTLDREAFLVGMWLVDQCLYGRKLPRQVDNKVWSSVGRLNVTIRLHRKQKERKKAQEKHKKK